MMRRFLKWLSAVLLFLVLLIVCLVAFIIHFIDPNRYKEQISAAVMQQYHRHLLINGPIEWSFFPWLGLQLHDVSLQERPGFGNQAFLACHQADIKIKLMPLFKKQLEVATLKLQGLQVNLIKNAQGIGNWQDLLSAQQQSSVPPQAHTHGLALAALAVANIQLQDATITWQDLSKQQFIQLQHLQLASQDINLNQAFPVELNTQVQSNQPAVNAQIQLKTHLQIDLATEHYLLQNPDLIITLHDPAYPQGQLTQHLQAAKLSLNTQQQTLALEQALLQIANLRLKGQLTGQQLLSNPQIMSTWQILPINLKETLAAFGKPLAPRQDSQALQQVSGHFDLSYSPDQGLNLALLPLQLDQTTLQGHLHFIDAQQLAVALKLNAIDVGRYLARKPEANVWLAENLTVNGRIASPKPYQLKQVTAKLKVTVAHLNLAKTALSELSTQVMANQGIIQLKSLEAEVYQGHYQGNITINLRDTVPSYQLQQHLHSVQLEPLLADLKPMTHLKLTGIAELHSQLSASGTELAALKQSLQGSVKFSVKQGLLQGIDLPYWLDIGTALYHRQSAPATINHQQTEFGDLTGTALINQGLVTNDDLLLQADFMCATGKGAANLNTERLNYQLELVKMNTTTHQPRKDVIPLLITGPFNDLKVRPDVNALLKKAAKQQLKHVIQEQLSKRLDSDVGNRLKQLNLDKLF